MSDRKPQNPPMRGGWFLRLARQRRLFHNALVHAGAAAREPKVENPALDLATPKTRAGR